MNKIAIISGSHRQQSQSLKIAKMMEEKLLAHTNVGSVEVVDLAVANVPQWSESYSDDEQAIIDGVKSQLVDADGFVVISPEWHGMVPSALKNLFLIFTSNVFAHKPGLIAAVSAGTGGAYPINELRTTVYKNSRLCFIPEHLIYRGVGSIFNGKEDDDMRSQNYMSKRTDFALEFLLQYADALKQVRANQPDTGAFPNGM